MQKNSAAPKIYLWSGAVCVCFFVRRLPESAQNRPLMTPFSSTSMPSAAGFLGRPGIVMILPITTTTKPAPAERRSLPHGHREAGGRGQQRGVVREAVLRLGDAHGQAAKAARVQLRKLLFCGGGKRHIRRAVNVVAYRRHLVHHGRIVGVGEAHGPLFQNAQHIPASSSPPAPPLANTSLSAQGTPMSGAQVPQVRRAPRRNRWGRH